MSNNLVEGMLVGRVDLGGSFQACPANYSAEDSMAASIVRLECEADELRAEVAMLKQGMVILAEERDEAREKAERYRLEANAMMAKLHELQTYADKLADGLPTGMLPRDVENLREANAGLADDLQKAERERDEARIQYRSTEALAMALVKTIDELKNEKADLFVQLVNLKAGSRRSTLDEIAESVREKYEPEHEGEGMDNE